MINDIRQLQYSGAFCLEQKYVKIDLSTAIYKNINNKDTGFRLILKWNKYIKLSKVVVFPLDFPLRQV